MKIYFIHHEFHNKSKSSSFMQEIFIKLGHEIEVFNRENSHVWLKRDTPDLYVLWQADKLLAEVVKTGKPILCIPMLDDVLRFTVLHFASYKNVKFISFSKALHAFLCKSGANSSYIQYWPVPRNEAHEKVSSILFWERNPTHLNLNDILNISKGSSLPIIIRQLPDPHDDHAKNLSNLNSNVVFLDTTWMESEKYLELVSSIEVHIAPRLWEGIGLTFIEAMGYGCCVVGFDHPTMNEYIKHGVNGILIKNRTSKVDFSRATELGIAARRSAILGWEEFNSKAIDFFESSIEEALSRVGSARSRRLPNWLTLRQFILIRSLSKKFHIFSSKLN